MHLCEDLLTEIFLKLPVLTLLRFRAVCKSWCSIIDSPAFTSQHFELFNKNSTKNQLLLIHAVTQDDGMTELEFEVVNQFTFDRVKLIAFLTENCKIHDIFNGLILYQQIRDPKIKNTMYPVLMLLNPSVRKVRTLCPCTLPEQLGHGIDNFALGFDSSSNDYKVIAFGGNDRVNANLYKIAVYSLNEDRWKMKNVHVVDNPISRYTVLLHHRHFCQGGVHWIRGGRDTVLYEGGLEHTHFSSFDFGVEEFRCLPLPGRKMFKCMFDFEKSLAVFGISAESSNMWIMREDVGEVAPERPWVRCFRGGSSLDAFEFFKRNKYARITNDEYSGVFFVLSWKYGPMSLMSYDIISRQIRTIRRVYGYRVCCADAYVESFETLERIQLRYDD
ncbi:putative F-box protein At5g52610 [Chenopodium quinoa]|uniref:F-box domain-containing protein n=1 Tax=Chenopodium quinoa TaxID=63459 RepID=A0A803MP44_CHEQI|nr:putative F-box protein At5g52610 [Chenopodium quinoa]